MKKILSSICSLSIFTASLANCILLMPSTQAAAEPYQKTFVITAYYSPLAGQDFYVTGSYTRDKILNGNGTHGASGTPVFDGMIAAPSTYAFGTQIDCGQYFSGTVTDRGGAIVKAGDSYSNFGTHAHDRLDIWAGKGTEALLKALHWGKRTLTCTVYPPGHESIAQFTNLPAGKNLPKANAIANKPTTNVSANSTKNISQSYKNLLETLGYDPDDKASLIAFQMRHNVISSIDQSDAGNFGPGTKAALDNIQAELNEGIPDQGLELGDVSSEVRILQEKLISLGYLDAESTAIFGDQTYEALVKYQLDQDLIDSKDHPAAGYVGPGTQEALQKESLEKHMISNEDQQIITSLNQEKIVAQSLAKANELEELDVNEEEPLSDEYLDVLEALSQEWIKSHTPVEQQTNSNTIQLASATKQENTQLVELKQKLTPIVNPFDQKLQLGSKGAEVQQIQQLLQEMGYFHGETITDYFGPQTQQAVIEFQVDLQVVDSANSPGAGLVGPKTLQALNATYYQHEYSLPYEVSQSIRAPAINPEDIRPQPLQQAKNESPQQS